MPNCLSQLWILFSVSGGVEPSVKKRTPFGARLIRLAYHNFADTSKRPTESPYITTG